MRKLFITLLAAACFAVSGADSLNAQALWRPTPRPETSAVDRGWYQRGEAIPFAGDMYVPSGPVRFFDGNIMVLSGSFDGVPLYVDPTVPAYREVLVPVGRGQVHPYERRGDPSWPRPDTWYSGIEWQPLEHTYREQAPPAGAREEDALTLPPVQPCRLEQAGLVETIREPEGNLGVWILFDGQRWRSAGHAVRLDSMPLVRIGSYHDVPVYAPAGRGAVDRIFLPARVPGRVAPFERF